MNLTDTSLKDTFQDMHQVARETASLLGKKVELVFSGENTILDLTVLKKIRDPLLHLIRNAIDHGIEMSVVRMESRKSPTGKILLSAASDGDHFIIEVTDDGCGIDSDRLYERAIEQGMISAEASLTEKQRIALIFNPGFSMKREISELSGRGVGLDIVKTNIEKLGGQVQVTTILNKGTTFRIQIPFA